jgi:hypothetical protein
VKIQNAIVDQKREKYYKIKLEKGININFGETCKAYVHNLVRNKGASKIITGRSHKSITDLQDHPVTTLSH